MRLMLWFCYNESIRSAWKLGRSRRNLLGEQDPTPDLRDCVDASDCLAAIWPTLGALIVAQVGDLASLADAACEFLEVRTVAVQLERSCILVFLCLAERLRTQPVSGKHVCVHLGGAPCSYPLHQFQCSPYTTKDFGSSTAWFRMY